MKTTFDTDRYLQPYHLYQEIYGCIPNILHYAVDDINITLLQEKLEATGLLDKEKCFTKHTFERKANKHKLLFMFSALTNDVAFAYADADYDFTSGSGLVLLYHCNTNAKGIEEMKALVHSCFIRFD